MSIILFVEFQDCCLYLQKLNLRMIFRKKNQQEISFKFLVLFCLSILFYQCDKIPASDTLTSKGINEDLVGKKYNSDFVRSGKVQREQLNSILEKGKIDSLAIPIITKELVFGLQQQLKTIKYQRHLQKEYSGIEISKKQLEETVKVLLTAQFDNSFGIKNKLDAHQIWGKDEMGNVHFTGYFTPVLKVRSKPNSIYKYPLYQYPKKWKGHLPTREEIEGQGVLDTFDLEIAYAKSKLDIYFMQVQGSGYVEFPNGKRKLLAHAGSNKHPYRSIGKYMVQQGYTTPEYVSLKSIKSYFKKHPEQVDSILFINPSYVFFTPVTTQPRGAGHVPITPNYSIAIDKKVLPLGSCLLASVPIIDDERNFSHHEYRILLAQDIGGAIKGPGHIDLYTGIGSRAERNASALHHYGNLWLLLPKDSLKSTPTLNM